MYRKQKQSLFITMAFPRSQDYFIDRNISAPSISLTNSYYELFFSSSKDFQSSFEYLKSGDFLFINAMNHLPSSYDFSKLISNLYNLDSKGIHWQLITYSGGLLHTHLEHSNNTNWTIHSFERDDTPMLLTFNYNPYLLKL